MTLQRANSVETTFPTKKFHGVLLITSKIATVHVIFFKLHDKHIIKYTIIDLTI